MNKYIVPICNLVNADIWIETYLAKSISDCQDKIIMEFSNIYDEENFSSYFQFLDIMDRKYNYSIGEIIDIETL